MKQFILTVLVLICIGCREAVPLTPLDPQPTNLPPGLSLDIVESTWIVLHLEDNSDEEIGFPLYQRLLADSSWQLNRILPADPGDGYQAVVFYLDSTATYEFQVAALIDSAGIEVELGRSEIVVVVMPYDSL